MLVGTLAHGIMCLWPVRIRLDSLEICLTAFHFVTIPHSPMVLRPCYRATDIIEPCSGPPSGNPHLSGLTRGPGCLFRPRRAIFGNFLYPKTFFASKSRTFAGKFGTYGRGGHHVDLTSGSPTAAISAPLRSGADWEPSFGRCLCGRNPRVAHSQPANPGGQLKLAGSAVPAVHQNLEFGRGERQVRRRRSRSCRRSSI